MEGVLTDGQLPALREGRQSNPLLWRSWVALELL
jgi:hypothetical protein